MIVADVVNREHRPVFLGMPSFRPEARKTRGSLRGYAQHHHRGAFVVINQRPEFTARMSKGPFRYDIFSRFRVALRGMTLNECSLEELGSDCQIYRKKCVTYISICRASYIFNIYQFWIKALLSFLTLYIT